MGAIGRPKLFGRVLVRRRGFRRSLGLATYETIAKGRLAPVPDRGLSMVIPLA